MRIKPDRDDTYYINRYMVDFGADLPGLSGGYIQMLSSLPSLLIIPLLYYRGS